jgi:hypothetical protein
MEWKKVIKANCMQLVFVFIAFFLMVEVSYLSVSDIVLQRLDDGVSDVIRAAEMNAELELKELLISLDALAESLRDALERGVPEGSAPSFPDFASAWTQGGVLPLFYGLVRGGAGDYHTLSSSSHIPQGIHEKLAWFLEKEKEAGARSAAPDRRVLYSEPRTNAATGMFVTAARGIYGHSGEFLGVIAVDIDTVWLSGSFFRLRTLEGSYGILLDERMHLIGHPKREFLGFPLWELDAAQGGSRKLYEKLAANNEFTGAAMKSLNGDSVVMSIRRMFNGWYIGTVIPFHVYYRDAHRTAAILSVVGFILAFCLGYVLLRLSAARIRSEEENQSKSTVLATISHEIRTPLNAIIGLSEMELRKEPPAQTRDNLEKILSSGSNLLAIINDILDISKITAGRLELLRRNSTSPPSSTTWCSSTS